METKDNPRQVTYLCLSNPEGQKLEIDLITFREKGQQIKYLSINFQSLKFPVR